MCHTFMQTCACTVLAACQTSATNPASQVTITKITKIMNAWLRISLLITNGTNGGMLNKKTW